MAALPSPDQEFAPLGSGKGPTEEQLYTMIFANIAAGECSSYATKFEQCMTDNGGDDEAVDEAALDRACGGAKDALAKCVEDPQVFERLQAKAVEHPKCHAIRDQYEQCVGEEEHQKVANGAVDEGAPSRCDEAAQNLFSCGIFFTYMESVYAPK